MARGISSFTTAVSAVVALSILGSTCVASSTKASPNSPVQTAATCPTFPGATAFVNRIDNRFLPLIPGSVYTYLGQEDGEKQRTVTEVTNETKTILGVQAVVVLDTVSDSHGGLIEQTFDWYAQDNAGNVWYLGEDTKEFENGQVVSTEGSWEAGVNGDQPGIIVEAQPRVGDAYNQECAPPDALDEARVDSLNAKVKTPYGDFGQTLRTRETTPLEPGFAENKFYAQCVGLVHEITVQGGHESMSLVDVQNAPNPTDLGCAAGSHHKHNHHRHNRHRHGH